MTYIQKLKALRIINEKKVDMSILCDYPCWESIKDKTPLTKDEFYLIKEVIDSYGNNAL